uniref:ARAD1A14168p n=1 Tax=Blastobotrys adeninivorans TaxID=409370 RepID=A0A060T444_BLAAD
MSLSGVWKKISSDSVLQRSSQVVAAVGRQAVVFGGELKPRVPRDNQVHLVEVGGESPIQSLETTNGPSPRVGSAAAVVSGRVYLFSGRGGEAMAPVEEKGAVWAYSPNDNSWELIQPVEGPYPAGRSYHCAASNGQDKIYIHAGCPEAGRLSDLWCFDLTEKKWTQLTSAPDPARGGTSIAYSNGLIYRMNGFDGKTEQGGQLDVYDPKADAWKTISYTPDGTAGPSPRSVSCLLPAVIRNRNYLITMFGERDPSSLGHQGAGKMLSDVWAFDIDSQLWKEVAITGDKPAARGWFDADTISDTQLVVQGGLSESNERISDIWVLDLN